MRWLNCYQLIRVIRCFEKCGASHRDVHAGGRPSILKVVSYIGILYGEESLLIV